MMQFEQKCPWKMFDSSTKENEYIIKSTDYFDAFAEMCNAQDADATF
jgi:hypothetical protein